MNEFKGIFKDELKSFIEYKKNNGFDYESMIHKLKHFDKYTINANLTKKELTKEFLIEYIYNHNNIKSSTKGAYVSIIRQFTIYLNIKDIPAFVFPEQYFDNRRNFKPYIYSKDEIQRLFKAIKECYLKKYPKKQEQIRLIFLILVKTGMRIGEVLTIKRCNIDYENNTILLENTKNDCDRLVVINDKLSNQLKSFEEQYNKKFEYYFENSNKKTYSVGCIYAIFRKILFKAKIMHTENGPRIHDIRHTFCTNSLKQAIDNNIDLNAFIPILSAYVGHKDLNSTYKYLHLTYEVFDDIRDKIKNIINIEREINYEEL